MTYVLVAIFIVIALGIGLAVLAWRRFSAALPALLDDRTEQEPEAPEAPEAPRSEGCRQVG
jgi:hypothetical protein